MSLDRCMADFCLCDWEEDQNHFAHGTVTPDISFCSELNSVFSLYEILILKKVENPLFVPFSEFYHLFFLSLHTLIHGFCPV